MLRSTFSRIRKVCSVALVPRDQCSAVSSAVIRKAHKSTKSTEDGERASTAKRNNFLPPYTFSSAADLRIDEKFKKKIVDAAGLSKTANETAKDNEPSILTPGLPLTHRERCQRIIDQAFGKSGNTEPDRVLSEQYFSHTVNLENTRREIHEAEKAKLKLQEQRVHTTNRLLPHDRSQYSIFKMSHELNLINDDKDEIIITHSASAKEPDLTKNLENVKGTAEETPPVEKPNLSQAKEDFDKCVNNPESIERKALCDDDAETIEVVKDERKPDMYQKATVTCQPHVPWFLNTTTTRECNLTYAKEDVDKSVSILESVAEKPLCDHAETTEAVKDEIKSHPYQDDTLNDKPHLPWFLNATTARERNLTYAKEDVDESVNNLESVGKKALNDYPETIEGVKDEIDLHQDATPNDQRHLPWFLQATATREHDLSYAKEDADNSVSNLEGVAEKPLCDNAETTEVIKDEIKPHPYQDDTLNDKPHLPWFLNATNARERNLTYAKEDVDKSVNNLESVGKKPLCDNAETTEVIKDEIKPHPYQDDTLNDKPHLPWFLQANPTRERNLSYAEEDFDKSVHNPENAGKKAIYNDAEGIDVVKDEKKHDLYQDGTPNDYLHVPWNLNATTAKQDEELLTQKLETIEETPIVEAHKPKLEENVPPRVLGKEPVRCNVVGNTQYKSPETNLPGALDEVSKRCLNCPLGQIDEMLINEMEKLGMTFRTSQKAPSTPMQDDLVQMDEQKIRSESPNFEDKENNTRIPDVNKQADALRRSEEIAKPAQDFKPLSFNSEEYNPADDYNSGTKFACNYLPPTRRAAELDKQEQRQNNANRLFERVPYINIGSHDKKWNKKTNDLSTGDVTQQCSTESYITEKSQRKPEQDSEKASLSEELLVHHTLDPYYVLTCNETCPISPGSSISASQNSDFVDTTETIYMKKNICESVRPKPQPIIKCEKMSQVDANNMGLEPGTMPEMKVTGVPEIKVTGMPEIKCTSIPDAIGMPRLDEQISLTELLRRVRERSRIQYSQGKAGSCGRKSPQCMPAGPRSPPSNPVSPPSFGLPMVKRRPPTCKPKRKPINKCSRATNFPEIPYELNEPEVCAVRSNVNLPDEVIYGLQNLGNILTGVLRQAKSNVEMLVRDYEPWAPVPSWNLPEKSDKKEERSGTSFKSPAPCIKGCPVFPKARASMNPDPPCPNLKPCDGFPKRRSFSMLDCFTVSLGEKKVYDLGDF